MTLRWIWEQSFSLMLAQKNRGTLILKGPIPVNKQYKYEHRQRPGVYALIHRSNVRDDEVDTEAPKKQLTLMLFFFSKKSIRLFLFKVRIREASSLKNFF